MVSLLMPNSVEYVIAYFACWQLGALAGPINSLLKAQEIAYVISNSEAKALLVNSEFLPVVETIRNELRQQLRVVIPFDNEAEATTAYDGTPAQTAETRLNCERRSNHHLHLRHDRQTKRLFANARQRHRKRAPDQQLARASRKQIDC